MYRKDANRLWREVSRGAPDGVPTGRTLHEFAQRVEALAIAGCDARHVAAMAAAVAAERGRCAALCLRPPGWLSDTHQALATEMRNAILGNVGCHQGPNARLSGRQRP